jgi:predicted phosphodiesterase
MFQRHRQVLTPLPVGRRAFMHAGTLCLTAGLINRETDLFAAEPTVNLRVGLITDLHHADKPPAGSRHYRESVGKLLEAGKQFKEEKIDFVVELGDLVDRAESVDVEMGYLTTINEHFSSICDDRHYVLGNHCVDTLTKREFLGTVGREQSYYSFDRGGFHFIVLDSCFRADGEPYGRSNFVWNDPNIPGEELDWLRQDLKATDKPVVIFAHQRLDVSTNVGVKNNAEVRAILEASGKVRVVLQGHSHDNDLKEISGIHYCTMVAMVEGSGSENNGYSVMSIADDGTIRISGFRKQSGYHWG